MHRRMVYLASPYTHADPAMQHQRFTEVCRCAAILMETGVFVFCPIAHFTPIANHGNLPHGWGFYKPFDTAFLRLCKAMLVCCLDGWETSTGVGAEVHFATQLGIPVGYLFDPLNAAVIAHYVRRAGLIGKDTP